jgi:hypothetical protein
MECNVANLYIAVILQKFSAGGIRTFVDDSIFQVHRDGIDLISCILQTNFIKVITNKT